MLFLKDKGKKIVKMKDDFCCCCLLLVDRSVAASLTWRVMTGMETQDLRVETT